MTKESTNLRKLVAVFNTDLQQYEGIQAMYESDIRPYFIELASDIRSPYYNKCSNYTVVSLGNVDKTGVIDCCSKIETLGFLSDYIDEKRVEYQRIIQTLNFLPTGYFKMPTEMQAEVQKKIEQAVNDYVNKYADIDLLFNKFNKDVKLDVNLPPANTVVDLSKVELPKVGA